MHLIHADDHADHAEPLSTIRIDRGRSSSKDGLYQGGTPYTPPPFSLCHECSALFTISKRAGADGWLRARQEPILPLVFFLVA